VLSKRSGITAGKTGPSAWQNFKKPDDATLRRILTPNNIRLHKGGDGARLPERVLDNKKEGIYVDIVSGSPCSAL